MVNRLSPLLFEQNCERQTLTDSQRSLGLTKGCWLWRPGRNPGHPYGLVKIEGENWLAHRASYSVHVGPLPHGKSACHHCDTPRCCEPEHLYPGTAKNNWQDMIAHGRHSGDFPLGARTKPRRSKLSDHAVRIILLSTEPQRVLAERFGVKRSAITNVRNGRCKRGVALDLPRAEAYCVSLDAAALCAKQIAGNDWRSDAATRIEARGYRARAKRLARAEARRKLGDCRHSDLLDVVVTSG